LSGNLYQQAVDYISSYTDYEVVPRLEHNAANYDLRRVEELLARLGNPHRIARSVHIAGTNGKGSTAAMVASALTVSGYTTGLYTSPHLHTWRERVRIDGELISEEEFTALVARLKPEIEAVNRKATYGRLTTFEILTTLAYAYFALKKADFQVLEVGLGGKFDATNVIQPEVCIITSVSFDHTEVLGNSLAEIAAEKAGIIKPGSAVVTSPQASHVARVISETCLAYGAELVRVGSDVTWQSLSADFNRQLFRVKGRLDSYQLSIPFLGRHQLDNAATAVAALEVLVEKGLGISRDSIAKGLAQVGWLGRLQILSHHPLLVVDGAHNPDSARRLRQSLEQYFEFERAILVIGASLDKDVASVVSELVPLFDEVIATRTCHPRAMAPSLIVAEFGKHGIEAWVAEAVPEALSMALNIAGVRDLICATGSLFVVGETMEAVNEPLIKGRLKSEVDK
jgi:dihydrofolate synthase/folylpolyglutamate synthase|tara:strand:+ start:1359 stop:2723 length:1365 start_codon:yes stop_codon:yes gene_type:complete